VPKSYREFRFPQVAADLGLTLASGRLFPAVPAAVPDPGLSARLARGLTLATAVNTEKARSEFLIAPVLDEARRLLDDRPALFSGVAFDVDEARGLAGVCDFLVSRDPMPFVVTAPVVVVAEGKNGVARDGFGQCIAGMVAAREFNGRAGRPLGRVYGAATNGEEWKLFQLAGDTLCIDTDTYLVNDPGRLLGVLCHIIERG
jgi:hypothetical protein